MSAGRMRMPEPIMAPTMMVVAVMSPSVRRGEEVSGPVTTASSRVGG
jgi:hypothetical protein